MMGEMTRSGRLSAVSSSVSLSNMMNMNMTQTSQGHDKCGNTEEFFAGISGNSNKAIITGT